VAGTVYILAKRNKKLLENDPNNKPFLPQTSSLVVEEKDITRMLFDIKAKEVKSLN
jgi:hypothetical protein